jgi:short-subunit dehydrogenase
VRIAVAGATGKIVARTVSFLDREGHALVRIGRSLGTGVILGHACHAATSRAHTADVDTRRSGVGARLGDRVVNRRLQPAGLLRCAVQAERSPYVLR